MKKIFTILIAVLVLVNANAQRQMVVQKKNGTTSTSDVNNINNVDFSSTSKSMTLHYTDGVSAICSTDDVEKVYFTDRSSSHEYVDLGLSVKWATCNVGAEKPEDYGDYFAWGETTGYDEGKITFSLSTYTLCQGSSLTMTKYCTDSSYGTVDNKTVLESTDDAATANWGSAWRMPTYDELDELSNTNNCSWTWYAAGNTEFNGVAGYKVQSLKDGYTDKYIFLPAAGYRFVSWLSLAGTDGNYWSSSLKEYVSYYAGRLVFHGRSHYMSDLHRCYGQSVRPVTE